MYKNRRLFEPLSAALAQFPAVLITGPRQSGKTTFLRTELGEAYHYVSFDAPVEREFALQDPNGFLDRFTGRPVILDEIQYLPELLPYLKIRIDRQRSEYGRWVLTGSQQFSLMQNVSESLAGRIALLELLPFSLTELQPDRTDLPHFIWNGGYPEPALQTEKRELWMNSYIQTYIERDIRLLHNVRDIRTFESFISLCAGRHGQVFNNAAIARQCGVSEPTVKSWGGLLHASYIAWFLPPYYQNYNKRIIRSPKFYFIDSGLVCALTRQPDAHAALAGQMGGALFEGMVVTEAVKTFVNRGQRPDLYFWRSHDGLEVDLIIRVNGRLLPVEIKLTATPSSGFLAPLNKFKAMAGKDASDTGVLVCRTETIQQMPHGNLALPWQQFPAWLDGLLTRS